MKNANWKNEIKAKITDQIIEGLENAIKFDKPWIGGNGIAVPKNHTTGRSYRGINVLNLWLAASLKGYKTGLWGSEKQWKTKGGKLRDGVKHKDGEFCIFYKLQGITEKNKNTGEKTFKKIPLFRYSIIFNFDQIEGIEIEKPDLDPIEENETAEKIINGTKATIKYGGEQAGYYPGSDEIVMPDRETFKSTTGFYNTIFHELSHWTGSENRLDRGMADMFGSEGYAIEELIAELSAAFICGNIGIAANIQNNSAYIKSWLKKLREDKNYIFQAASKADKSCQYILGDHA